MNNPYISMTDRLLQFFFDKLQFVRNIETWKVNLKTKRICLENEQALVLGSTVATSLVVVTPLDTCQLVGMNVVSLMVVMGSYQVGITDTVSLVVVASLGA